MLLIGLRTRAAAVLVSGMLLTFTLAVGLALLRGLDMSCGCFASQGIDQDPISWRTLVRDGVWLSLSLYVLIFDQPALGVDRWLHRRSAGVGSGVGPGSPR